MTETSKSISEWAVALFGESGSDARVAARALQEMAELFTKVTSNKSGKEIAEECADVVIVLARLANRNGYDIFEMVDEKMKVNRARKWVLDGTGHGYHVK